MAIYRPPKARWPLAAGAGLVCLILGLIVGLAIGNRDPDPLDIARDLKTDLLEAAGSLEVAGIEYEESVANGEVVKRTEYDGSVAAVRSSRERYDRVAPALRSLAPARAAEIEDRYESCTEQMLDRADATSVAGCLDDLGALLKGES